MLEPVKIYGLKRSIKKMRKGVLIALLQKKGAKFSDLDVEQQMLLGKSNEEIYALLMSKQTMLFKVQEWVLKRRQK